MPDVLTPEERAAIAAYKGDREWRDVVQHIPLGTSGLAEQRVFRPRSDPGIGAGQRIKNRVERRALQRRIAKLHDEGRGKAEIALAVGLSVAVVTVELRAAKLLGLTKEGKDQ